MTYLTITGLNLAIADTDEEEVYQLGEISVTPGRFSISDLSVIVKLALTDSRGLLTPTE